MGGGCCWSGGGGGGSDAVRVRVRRWCPPSMVARRVSPGVVLQHLLPRPTARTRSPPTPDQRADWGHNLLALPALKVLQGCATLGGAQPQHTNHWAPRTRKRHQQEHRPQRPTESSDPTQHAKGRTGDCPGPRKETTTRRHVTWGGVEQCTTSFRPFSRWSRVPHSTRRKPTLSACLVPPSPPVQTNEGLLKARTRAYPRKHLLSFFGNSPPPGCALI